MDSSATRAGIEVAFRIVKEAAGHARVQLIPGKCRFLVAFGVLCLEPVRLAPGAIYCEDHRNMENAGCAEHDKLNCKHRDCQ